MNVYVVGKVVFRVNSKASRDRVLAALAALAEDKDCEQYDIRSSSHEPFEESSDVQ